MNSKSFKNSQINLNFYSTDVPQITSFRPIIDKISALKDDAPYGARLLANELLKLINPNHNFEKEYDAQELKPIFEIIANLSGDLKLSHEEYVAFASPIPDTIIYSTAAFQKLLDGGLEIYEIETGEECFNIKNKVLYYLILERFYNINKLDAELIFESKNDGFCKYYELKIDFTFVDIEYEGKLPRLDLTKIKDNRHDSYDLLNEALSSIDLTKFKFEGFSILRFINRDKDFLIRRIQDVVKNINLKNKESLSNEIDNIFKSILRKEGLSYFFLPILELSGFPITENEYTKQSILLGQYLNFSKACNNCSIYSYLSKPIIWSYGIENDLNIDDEVFIEILQSRNITNYLGIPLFYRERFVGFIEIYSNSDNFNKNDALKLKSFLPHFAQLSNDFVEYLKNQLDKIILENYTSIQPALQWRFNEVAVSYLSKINIPDENVMLDEIVFKDIYPIYGAVDIKDSTRIRNATYKQVIIQHLKYIDDFLNVVSQQDRLQNIDIFKENIRKVFKYINDKGIEKNIVNIRTFLEKEVSKLLDEVRNSHFIDKELSQIILQIEEHNAQIIETGNDPFEKSLSTLTKAIKHEYDVLNNEIQHIFPCYFETFRTDGIEYDGYIGQSITPTQTFNITVLHDVRKKQILSMIRIIKKARELSAQLPIPLRTTQLLFVHPDKISISFREDEKRFDVEGGYNIRYQIIKKRIDKALIENSRERLVQPETIAIVFSNETVSTDILDNLKEIALMGLIHYDFEFHTLEELQGVSELRAIRVKVI
ncbi:hypothetical protein [Sphingobacterium bovistauri]|uniref:GAF domain-containing protein n=1 Tax=Sphingobacterium bovistauri TaxID=2781959 RepID=A0ABS7Z455_9SPHI|nr:hypothetical protein [Sphingobacterium bovistauri]MCA5004940.1 hypothetical protein [Sphingobacterium bovistauri]